MAEIENPYNNPESVKVRKEQEDPWIMYLIVRDSLGMSPGKTAAQVGHAVGMLYEHRRTLFMYSPENYGNQKKFDSWKRDSFRKVVLKAKDKQWEKLKDKLYCFVVRDAGLTEVDPGSETVIGVWPMKKSERINILRKLQTLK